MGLEPIRGCPQQILSLPRLPFRHAGIYSFSEQMIYYHTPKKFATKKLKKQKDRSFHFPITITKTSENCGRLSSYAL